MEEQPVVYCESSDEFTLWMWPLQKLTEHLCFKKSAAISQQYTLAMSVLLYRNWILQYCGTSSKTALFFLCKGKKIS